MVDETLARLLELRFDELTRALRVDLAIPKLSSMNRCASLAVTRSAVTRSCGFVDDLKRVPAHDAVR